MPNDNEKLIERLREQVKRAEERGQFDTCHHTMLANLLSQSKTDEGITPRNTKKVTQEAANNG